MLPTALVVGTTGEGWVLLAGSDGATTGDGGASSGMERCFLRWAVVLLARAGMDTTM